MEEEQKNDSEETTPPPFTTPAEAGAQPSTSPEEKCAEMESSWKRALADYQNLQREVARERAEMGQYAVLRVVERFLPVFDNFNVAVSHMPQSEDKAVVNWAVGVGYIQKQMEDALKDLGLQPIKVTPGEKFDPEKHEAVSAVSDSHHGYEIGSVLKELQSGYELNGKIVRPAKVYIVSEHSNK